MRSKDWAAANSADAGTELLTFYCEFSEILVQRSLAYFISMTNCCAYELQAKHIGFADCLAEDFYVSQWCRGKISFVIYRAIFCLYWIAWVAEGIVEYSYLEGGHFYYVYLSHWNEWVLLIYFVISLVVALIGLQDSNLSGKLRWYHKANWIVRDTGIVSSYLVTIIFYCANVKSRTTLISSIHRHAISSAMYTIDLFVSGVPVRFLHFIYPSLYFVCYAVFTLLLHWSKIRSKLYDKILDWEQIPGISAAVFVSVVVIVAPLLHSIVFMFYHIRAFTASKISCNSRSNGLIPAQEVTDDDKETPSSCDSIA